MMPYLKGGVQMKLIICDMSGIVSIKGRNNVELLSVLNTLKNFAVTFCTGKGYLGGQETLKGINIKIPFICENGSVIVDKDGRVIYNSKMSANKAKRLILELSKMHFEFVAYVDLATHKYKFLRGDMPLSEELTQPWFHSEEIYWDVNDFIKNIDLDNVCRITTRGLSLAESGSLSDNFQVTISENEFHSICNIGINKGYGVMKLAEICGVKLDDIIVIGNDYNDIDMFKINCGYKIVTGENQPPEELVALADKYVPLNDLPRFIKEIDKSANI